MGMTKAQAESILAKAAQSSDQHDRRASTVTTIADAQDLLRRYAVSQRKVINEFSGNISVNMAAHRLEVGAFAEANGLTVDDDWFGECFEDDEPC